LVDEARGRVVQAVKEAEAAGELVFRRGADEIIP
jgi:flagellar motor switch protein FliG